MEKGLLLLLLNHSFKVSLPIHIPGSEILLFQILVLKVVYTCGGSLFGLAAPCGSCGYWENSAAMCSWKSLSHFVFADQIQSKLTSNSFALQCIACARGHVFNPIKGGPLTEGSAKNHIAPSQKYFSYIVFVKY